jgi:RND family efflux transporter MFP subunit
MLVRLDSEEYQLAITKAEATVASAKQQLAKAEAEYKQKQKEYSGVNLASVSDFALRKPEFEEAKARLKAAEADLKLASLQLRRCTIYAPFDGRVVKTLAGMGQLVMPSAALAEIYAVDIAEILLPISEAQSGLLELPAINAFHNAANGETDNVLPVKLRGRYAGRDFTWDAEIVRTDASIDERNRLQNLIAQVDDPYGLRHELTGNAPLLMGMFVEAEIEGRLLDNIYVLPRSALHNRNTVWLLDEALQLRQQEVSIVHRGKLNVYVSDGISASDRVITSPLDVVVDGMQLRVINPEKI